MTGVKIEVDQGEDLWVNIYTVKVDPQVIYRFGSSMFVCPCFVVKTKSRVVTENSVFCPGQQDRSLGP